MASAAQALPGPGAGPSPGGGVGASPAPAQPGASQTLELVRTIASAAKLLSIQVPGTVPGVRKIHEALQEMQQAIIASQPPTEPQAPPI